MINISVCPPATAVTAAPSQMLHLNPNIQEIKLMCFTPNFKPKFIPHLLMKIKLLYHFLYVYERNFLKIYTNTEILMFENGPTNEFNWIIFIFILDLFHSQHYLPQTSILNFSIISEYFFYLSFQISAWLQPFKNVFQTNFPVWIRWKNKLKWYYC